MLEAGRIQLASFGKDGLRIDKKGAIDLVTEVDVAVERRFRAFIAERFPDHAILAEEMGGPDPGSTARHCWIFDPIDGTTNFAHGLPIFCASLALEIDGELIVGAIYDPTRDELFTAERGGGAYLNGRRLAVTHADALIDALLCTGFHYDVHRSGEAVLALFGAFVAPGPRRPPAGLGGARPGLRGGRPLRRLLGGSAEALGRRGGCADRRGSGRGHQRAGRRAVRRPQGRIVAANPALHPQLLEVIRQHRVRRAAESRDGGEAHRASCQV